MRSEVRLHGDPGDRLPLDAPLMVCQLQSLRHPSDAAACTPATPAAATLEAAGASLSDLLQRRSDWHGIQDGPGGRRESRDASPQLGRFAIEGGAATRLLAQGGLGRWDGAGLQGRLLQRQHEIHEHVALVHRLQLPPPETPVAGSDHYAAFPENYRSPWPVRGRVAAPECLALAAIDPIGP